MKQPSITILGYRKAGGLANGLKMQMESRVDAADDRAERARRLALEKYSDKSYFHWHEKHDHTKLSRCFPIELMINL